jgi:hypothetical protein
MKKFSLIILTVFLNGAIFSCTPNSLAEDEIQYEQQATEGEDGEVSNGESEDDDDETKGN